MSFLTEGFESTTVGSVPTGWSTNVPSVVKVTSADSYSGGRSLGFGNSSANSGYSGYTGTGAVWSGAITTARANSALAVSFRTRYNIQPGDTAIVGRLSSGGSILSSQSSGVSGSSGGWVHKTVFIPNVNDATYGDLRVQPIIFGLNVASNPSSGAGYYWEIDDVRVVPILSSTLGLWGTETAGSARDEAYQYSNGTSMACPAVAGMAALVREYYQERKNFPNPSSALVKATLITSAASMGSGQYGTGSTQEIPPARPNSVNGWGRADLQKAVAPSTTSYPNTRQLFADVSTGLKTGGVDTYTVNVSAGTPLNVGLVWTDPAATVAASVTLVNNLDLAVDPDGVGTGVAASPGNGVAGDDRNTVETVDFTAPSSGTYTITVTGTNVPTGQQPYALVIYGDVSWQDTLIVSPATTTCELGGKTPFTAMVNGRPTTAATWSVVSGGGNISTSGLYTAPGSGTTATVRATYGSLTKDATITFVTATSQATAYIVVYTGDITRLTGITVGVGPNPDSPIASSQFSYALSGSPGIWTLWFNVDALVPYLPPDSSTPWWARIHTNGSSVGTMIDFYVLRGTRDGTGYVTSGQRFSSTNLPIDLAATTGPPYGWIDTAAPTVSLTTPASDATVSGSVNFSADATDNDRIARVDFLVDDRLIGTDTTASGNSYSVTWDTTAETNIRHRLTVRAADKSGNIAEDFHLVTTNNAGSRPNVALTMGSWSFNSTTRDLTATASFTNTGSADAYKVTLQRLTLYATGSTFSGFRQVYMEPSSGSPFPRNVGTVTTGTSTTLTLHAILPPEVTAIPRWAGAGTYYDASSGGSKYNL
jgi:hypothetical protein